MSPHMRRFHSTPGITFIATVLMFCWYSPATANCPQGQFLNGLVCQNCTCPAARSTGCDNSTGDCICTEGYTGAECDECVLGINGAIWTSSGCRGSSTFFPFGPGQGDSTLPNIEQSTTTVTLPISFPFGNSSEQRLVKISSSGTLTFSTEAISYFPNEASLNDAYVIAPFWSVALGTNGTVFYNVHTSGSAVDLVLNATATTFPDADFPALNSTVYVLVVTWINIRHPGRPGRNSFQGVVATDNCFALAFLNYDNSITWTGSDVLGDRQAIAAIAKVGEPLFSIAAGDLINQTRREVQQLTPACYGIRLKRIQCRVNASTVLRLPDMLLPTCPSSLFLILSDGRYIITVNDQATNRMCFVEKEATLFNAVCCYRYEGISNGVPVGFALLGGRDGSFVTPHARNDHLHEATGIDLQRLCCDVNKCSAFYEVRPRPFLHFTVMSFGGGFNDPHFVTMDGKSYTFNGLGEYLLFDTMNGTARVQIQGRTTEVPGSVGTYLSAVAVGFYSASMQAAPSTRIMVSLNGDVLHFHVDGSNITDQVHSAFQAGWLPFEPNEHMAISFNVKNRTQVSFSNGITLEFPVFVGRTITMLSVVCSVPPTFHGRSFNRGLLGNLNSNPDDDFKLNNMAMVLPSNSTERELFQFGQSYQLVASQVLFYYFNGLSLRDFSDPSHGMHLVYSDEIPLEYFSIEAQGRCGGNRMCLFDSNQTNDVDVGVQTAVMGRQFATDRSVATNPPPVIVGQGVLNATNGVQVQYTFNVTDPEDTFNLTLVGENQPAQYNIFPTEKSGQSGTYVLSFIPTTATVNVRIQARDSTGGLAEHQVASILCPCENNQPCVEAEPGVDGGSSGFTLLTCDCGEAWAGTFCEQNRNACVDGNSCYPNVTCTDNSPPDAGVQCGQCPTGLTGNGVTCEDIDECTTGDHVCQIGAKCVNTFRSYNCECGRTCMDINECATGVAECSPFANCTNAVGSYECACFAGYAGNGFQCSNIDECESAPCMNGGLCQDGVASFICRCRRGIQGERCQEFSVQLDLGEGFGVPFVTAFTEDSSSVLLTISHRANIINMDPSATQICSLNITLKSTPENGLDSEELIFPTKAPPFGIMLTASSNHHLFFMQSGATTVNTNDWASILDNIEYINNTDEPTIATRRVEFVAFLCSSNAPSQVAITELKINRINDHPPRLILRLR